MIKNLDFKFTVIFLTVNQSTADVRKTVLVYERPLLLALLTASMDVSDPSMGTRM